MCNFIHKKKNGRQFELGRSCDVEKFCNEQGISIQDTLPHDIDNFCIFHSKNQSWKSSLNVNDTIQKLSSNFLDGGSFNFFPFTESEFYDNIDISNKKIEKNLNFSYSNFYKNLNIENIEGTITGKEITVKDKLSIKNSPNLNSVVFNNSNIRELVINSANFNDSVIFSDCYVLESFEIKNSNFYSYTLFDNININADSANGKFIYIGQDSSFNENLDFSGATFNGQLVFRDVKLKHADFVNIKTLESPDYSNIVYESVSFFSVTVMEFGKVNFKGTTNLKLFNQGVIFQNFKVDGLVEFENVDFQKIAPASRKDLINQSKGGNIIIGGGCLKYRHQTDIISHITGSLTQKLIEDMTNTYINFFTKHNGLNLGFEIVEKTPQKIAYFYFSDEDITNEEFMQYLRYTEQDMWLLTKNETPTQRLSSDLQLVKSEDSRYQDYTKASLASSLWQFGLGLTHNDTKPKELDQLVGFVGFPPSIESYATTQYLRELIEEKFNNKNLILQYHMHIGTQNNYGNQFFADTMINGSNILSSEDSPLLKLIHDNATSETQKLELVQALETIRDNSKNEVEKSHGKELWKKFLESGVGEVAKEAVKTLISPTFWAIIMN